MSKTLHSANKQYRYFDWIMAAFVTILVCSNVIGASKVCEVFGFTFSAGNLFFPLSYLFGDIITEVYGYKRARRIVWAGFAALLFASAVSAFIVYVPPSGDWHNQEAYEIAFGNTWRISMCSLIAFWAGELTNSYALAKMKVWTKGRFLWTRTISSTIVGEGVDSLIFYPCAFLGTWPTELVMAVMMQNYAFKVLWEIVMTPFTYRIVNYLKRAENEDYFDYQTNFNPFSVGH